MDQFLNLTFMFQSTRCKKCCCFLSQIRNSLLWKLIQYTWITNNLKPKWFICHFEFYIWLLKETFILAYISYDNIARHLIYINLYILDKCCILLTHTSHVSWRQIRNSDYFSSQHESDCCQLKLMFIEMATVCVLPTFSVQFTEKGLNTLFAQTNFYTIVSLSLPLRKAVACKYLSGLLWPDSIGSYPRINTTSTSDAKRHNLSQITANQSEVCSVHSLATRCTDFKCVKRKTH